jgi:hypothetical protein
MVRGGARAVAIITAAMLCLPPSLLADGQGRTKQPESPPPPLKLDLKDLGFSQGQLQTNEARQRLLDERSLLLKRHQRMGLITAVPFLATILTAGGAKGHQGNHASGRNVHALLGLTTATLYFITASYAFRAPKIPGIKREGPTRIHRALAWIHFPAMVLTPILGAMAYNQERNGQKVHGIAKLHGVVAATAFATFVAAMLAVSIRF